MMRGLRMDVSVITVTFNSAPCIAACVESVLAQRETAHEMIIVDNASTDNTLEVLTPLAGRVRVIVNYRNAGFGTGCNQGARAGNGRFLLFLNPDASLPQADALRRLIHNMAASPQWALCGTPEEGQARPPLETRYPGERHLRRPLPALPGRIAWVLGASMFVRRSAFESVKGFDERFFLYCEEADLCLRLRQAGHEIGMVDDVWIRHLGGASERGFPAYETWRRKLAGLGQFYRNQYDREDIARLWRRDLLRARWRLACGWLAGDRRRRPERVAKYSALRDAAREELSRLKD
jgi:N-acetylglucosaminyl-diphospho-decaprenol L-rhamnosyltransferase